MVEQFFGLTDTGKERNNNEDTFIAQQSANGKFIIACVIDGVGGYSGGEVAASLTREAILQRLNKPSGEVIPMMIDCFNRANEKILEEKKQVKEHNSMACVATLALVDMEHNQFYYVHVGDTRLYLLRDNSLVKISHDQSFVGFLEDSGRITEDAAMSHPKRNEINKALGFEPSLAKDGDYIETGQSPFLSGDMLLLCSDGLTDMVGTAEITDTLTKANSLKDKCHELINAANQHGGRDNITAVLVQNNRLPLKHAATMPAANSKKNDPTDELIPAGQHTSHTSRSQQPETTAKSKAGIIAALTILMLIFLGTTVWQYLQNKQAVHTRQKTLDTLALISRNKQEIKLQNAIDQVKGHILILWDTAYTTPIIISRAIQVNKDSLLIKAKGKIELQADSGYKGAAFSLAATCKDVMLDSLVISNFQTGVIAFDGALSLKNIRFVNCVTPFQNAFRLSGKKYINGKIPALIFRADSLPVTDKQK